MVDLREFIMRHGEFGAQALIEQIERNEGLRPQVHASLEQRWDAVMNGAAPVYQTPLARAA